MQRVDVRIYLVLAMRERRGPQESETKVWEVRGKSGASRVMEVRQEDKFKMKAVVFLVFTSNLHYVSGFMCMFTTSTLSKCFFIEIAIHPLPVPISTKFKFLFSK